MHSKAKESSLHFLHTSRGADSHGSNDLMLKFTLAPVGFGLVSAVPPELVQSSSSTATLVIEREWFSIMLNIRYRDQAAEDFGIDHLSLFQDIAQEVNKTGYQETQSLHPSNP
jgi:hypothetical protein